MKRSVRLSLKKETLSALTGDDLSAVAGAADNSAVTCYSCPIGCIIQIDSYSDDLTNCCQGIPTFHRAAC